MNYNRVVAYGCSYTYGAELNDHKAIGKSRLKTDKEKKKLGYKGFATLYGHKLGPGSKKINHVTAMHNASWANKVRQCLQIKHYENRAISGISNEQMIYSLEKDYIEGKIEETDLVLVGLTSLERFMYFDLDGHVNRTLLVTPESQIQRDLDNVLSYVLNEYYVVYNFIKTLTYLQHLKDTLPITIIAQPLHTSINDLNTKIENKNHSILKMLKQIEDYSVIIDPNISFWKILSEMPNNGADSVHGFHHPHEQIHDLLVSIILNKIREKI